MKLPNEISCHHSVTVASQTRPLDEEAICFYLQLLQIPGVHPGDLAYSFPKQNNVSSPRGKKKVSKMYHSPHVPGESTPGKANDKCISAQLFEADTFSGPDDVRFTKGSTVSELITLRGKNPFEPRLSNKILVPSFDSGGCLKFLSDDHTSCLYAPLLQGKDALKTRK